MPYPRLSTLLQPGAEPQTQSGEDSAQDSGGESMEPSDEVQVSTDPLEMITEGYYSFTYSVEGMDDMKILPIRFFPFRIDLL